MSFNDLERGPTSSSTPVRGAGVGGALLPTQQAVDPEFKRLADRTAIQILKINSNVANIDRLLSLSSRSQPKDWSARITALLDSTRDLIHHSTADVKTLSTQYAAPGAHADKPELQQQQYKATVSKLQTDFEAALRGFQRVQKGSAERSRRTLDAEREKERRLKSEAGGDRTSVVSNAGSSAGGPSSAATGAAGARYKDSPNDTALVEFSSPRNDSQALLDDAGGEQQQQQQQQQLQGVVEGPSQADIEFQEALIAEREAEIREIEGGVHELNEIFRDLANIVQEQGGMIDNIEYNITSIATNTQAADRELVQAHEYQRKAGRRALCLLLVVGFVIAVVLLALLS
ncbi:SNAP receptor [Tilletia horrida]|uniref:SNAP receptor n=1 Tax=Tilletia horrida TaxID=155126 RepID=A0AAN6JN98_9BASI|nr:SNAP receptor [Tilletia horrida]KAK0540150.1 SNAP receptor [Tilletia horrida]